MKKINYYRGLLMAGLVVLHLEAAAGGYEVIGQEVDTGTGTVVSEEVIIENTVTEEVLTEETGSKGAVSGDLMVENMYTEEIILEDIVVFENGEKSNYTEEMRGEEPDIHPAPKAEPEVLPEMTAGTENTWNTVFADKEECDVAESDESGKTDFVLTVTEDVAEVKAGEMVGYEILLENIGNVNLEKLELRSILDNGNLEGEWLRQQGLDIDAENGTAVLDFLEAGSTRTLVLMAEIPEEWQEDLTAEFVAKVRNPFFEEESATETSETEFLYRSQGLTTKIRPLNIEFTVHKWADRAIAVVGDTITYQICIRNTGERSLHSVLTTERFQKAGIKAHFMEAEGVILNGEKTEALISEIKPGEAASLFAQVTIPKNCEAGELLNEVTVVTRETGKKDYYAQASVEVVSPLPTEAAEKTVRMETVNGEKIKEVPRTEDLSETELWAGAFGISCLIVIGIYWLEKAKRKR